MHGAMSDQHRRAVDEGAGCHSGAQLSGSGERVEVLGVFLKVECWGVVSRTRTAPPDRFAIVCTVRGGIVSELSGPESPPLCAEVDG